jgi:pyroglutamyl-peptidase
MKEILVTAFEPFGGETVNPTEIILRMLPDATHGYTIRKLLLPVEFKRSCELALAEYDRLSPVAVIMLGQAGGRSAITPEATARNVMNASIPDNCGYKPEKMPIAENGPDTLPASFPVQRIREAIDALGLPCELSDHAGQYVCNTLFYSMLLHNNGAVPTGFIHVPYIREQRHEDKPFMELDDIRRGILAAIEAVTETIE